jgi:hypothetical protein
VGGPHYSINSYAPSFDGAYVACGVSPGGSENTVLHIIETATGRQCKETIDRASQGFLIWLPDGRCFLYTRLRAASSGRCRGLGERQCLRPAECSSGFLAALPHPLLRVPFTTGHPEEVKRLYDGAISIKLTSHEFPIVATGCEFVTLPCISILQSS